MASIVLGLISFCLVLILVFARPEPGDGRWPRDDKAKFLDENGVMTSEAIELRALFGQRSVVIHSESLASRCVKGPGQAFGQRQLFFPDGYVQDLPFSPCWR